MKRAIPLSVVIVGMSLLYPLQVWVDATSPRIAISEESLYLSSGKSIKKASLNMHSLVADIYWIRAIQYFGRKLIESGEPLTAGNLSHIRMDLLIPLLNIIVELDPRHIQAYRFGAIFLPERDLAAAISLLERGIEANPDEWRLYQDLGYIYWQSGNYEKAAEYYEKGGQLPNARWWMRDLAGLMRIKGGSRETARTVYEQYLESEDENIRGQAAGRLKQLDALDEVDAINSVIERYKQQMGACPASLRQLAPALRQIGFSLNNAMVPVDPEGFPYELDARSCQAGISPASTIIR